ncbi:hypothetical protein KIPB_017239, partial [Kipferlia bialata]
HTGKAYPSEVTSLSLAPPLDLQHRRIPIPPSLTACAAFDALRSVDLGGCAGVDPSLFASLPVLVSLRMDYCDMDDVSML